jgi:uncharacterized protein (TIGR00661 family)
MPEEKRKILISPLNWGFGHAGRMIPVAIALKNRGHEVIFGLDRSLIPMIEPGLPGIEIIEIPGITMRYSRHMPQYLAVLLQTPAVIVAAFREHTLLKRLIKELSPDIVISDNRFGFFNKKAFCVYFTHMLRIPYPRPFRFLEFTGLILHRIVLNNYNLCLIPDLPGKENLSGRLSHLNRLPRKVLFAGPLSRFAVKPAITVTLYHEHPYICLILSGPEPQRSMLLEKVVSSGLPPGKRLVVLSGTEITGSKINNDLTDLVVNPSTEVMRDYIKNSWMVVCRSGYTTIMELFSLNKGAVIIPTPGQTEQEYLAEQLNGRYGFCYISQNNFSDLDSIVPIQDNYKATDHGFSMDLLNISIDRLLEQEHKRKNH